MATVYDQKLGKSVLRIVSAGTLFKGVILRDGKRSEVFEDDDLERLKARLRNEAGRLHPDYTGFDAAKARFLQFFAAGFHDPAYIALERSYKLAARDRLREALPLEAALDATAEQAANVRRAFYTNLLSQFELARMHAVLVGSTGREFVRGAAQFTLGDHLGGIASMAKAIAPHGRASWPMITYLSNLWAPDEHMFLKPEKTKDFAARTGHPFAEDYEAALEPAVYVSLLNLVDQTEKEIANLEPRDRIDVQGFIWVVGDYKEAQHEEISAARLKLG